MVLVDSVGQGWSGCEVLGTGGRMVGELECRRPDLWLRAIALVIPSTVGSGSHQVIVEVSWFDRGVERQIWCGGGAVV